MTRDFPPASPPGSPDAGGSVGRPCAGQGGKSIRLSSAVLEQNTHVREGCETKLISVTPARVNALVSACETGMKQGACGAQS